MWATATGKRPDCGSVQFSPMCIFCPVYWTCEHYLLPISTVPELHEEYDGTRDIDNHMRFMLQKFPHHQGQLNPGTLSAITQGLSWSTMYPTQPLLTGEKSAPPIDSQPSRTDGSMGKKKVKWDDTTLWDDKTSIECSRHVRQGQI
jgi:hypothetical protein